MDSLPLPPTAEAMGQLTAEELHRLASAVVAEQHRRSGPEARKARTAAANLASRTAKRRERTPEQRKAQTAKARKRLQEHRLRLQQALEERLERGLGEPPPWD